MPTNSMNLGVMNNRTLTVYKQNHVGEVVFQYDGVAVVRTDAYVVLEAYFGRDDYPTDYHTFKRGDRMLEWFFNDRWYNIFELHHRDTDTLEGWYCNITRPASFADNGIYADDLAIDVMVYPDGTTRVLDMDEFEVLPISSETRSAAEAGLQALLDHIQHRRAPFDLIATT